MPDNCLSRYENPYAAKENIISLWIQEMSNYLDRNLSYIAVVTIPERVIVRNIMKCYR